MQEDFDRLSSYVNEDAGSPERPMVSSHGV
jgi:hypothetical protein